MTTTATTTKCPSCSHEGLELFYEVRGVPVHSCIMLQSEREAREFPTGDVQLGFCRGCGFVTNAAFDATVQDYTPVYEDQQSFSPTFNAFAKDLAQRLIDRFDLRGKKIVEVGCGKADFLALLCELGDNRGVGIDPTCREDRLTPAARERVTLIQDYYSEKYGDQTGDLVCCRHTLEHIINTEEFVGTIRRSIGDRHDTVVFFEIPDGVRVMKDVAFWDVYYEHCSYFSPGSLARLFRRCGFEVTDVALEYDEQYLVIECKPARGTPTAVHPLEESIETMAGHVEHFREASRKEITRWREFFSSAHAAGKRVSIWGSGSKCVAFMTTIGIRDEVHSIVDINPHRHGKFIPGVGMEVKSPQTLEVSRPDTVIIMNAIYEREIKDMMGGMGIAPETIPL